MKFAKYVFALAGLYGLVTLVPAYFLEAAIAASNPPAITHPEFFYGSVERRAVAGHDHVLRDRI